ncbi:MAG: prolipoprotein diacylglyceryl transferase [Gammaproteobacteria bacterium]|nr:prolipoprotein diacylglyceryl transferase [Gammaproteobacteria bacterium]
MSLPFPEINPVAFSIGPVAVHWYGLMYLLGFGMAWLLAKWRVKHLHLQWTDDQIGDLIFYAAMGLILGGRIGYMLFYNSQELMHDPISLFKVWQGGMSFHGGLMGGLIALYLFAKRIKKPFWVVADFLAPLVPLGLAAGRIGNFINGELWGRATTMPWGMVFPEADFTPRHPSQLYECGLEGLLLFIVIWWYARKPRPSGAVSAVFLMGYALCRFGIEFFREPDPQLGYIALHWVTMGQLLSLPMFLFGLYLYFRAQKHANIS